jgi:hypothetical protein
MSVKIAPAGGGGSRHKAAIHKEDPSPGFAVRAGASAAVSQLAIDPWSRHCLNTA